MSTPGLKGFVLAAGYGNRLRPLTSMHPKPLVPFLETSPLELAIGRLWAADIVEVAVNAHHLPEQIERATGNLPWPVTVKLSREQEILGTGGAYNPLRPWIGRADLVVYNGDIVTDFPLERLIELHRSTGADATMGLLPEALPGERGVLERGGRVVGFAEHEAPGTAKRNFACIQILSATFVEKLPRSGSFDVISHGYEAALEGGATIAAYVHEGPWYDLRDPETYAHTIWDILENSDFLKRLGVLDVLGARGIPPAATDEPRNFVARTAQVDPTAKIGPYAVVGGHCQVGAGASLHRAILWPGTAVAPGDTVENVILGPEFSHPLKPVSG